MEEMDYVDVVFATRSEMYQLVGVKGGACGSIEAIDLMQPLLSVMGCFGFGFLQRISREQNTRE